ncbi:MAG: phage tail tape measure protein [Candidatus Accumulibacter sp.]|nr:phage tail tape measure protein [Accumulibacter sp.]
MAIATLTIDLVAKLATLERDLGKAAQIAERNAKRIESSFAAAGKALGAIGAAISVGAFAGMVRSLADAGDQLQKLSTKTGETVENLSKLQYAASLSDLSNEDLGASLIKLNRVMGDAANGSKEAAEALARFGIVPDSGLSAIEAFQKIATAVKSTGDETKIASALNDVFGKSFATLLPLLKTGGDEIQNAGDELERMGGVMSGDLARSSEAFNDNITRLTKALDALKMDVIGPLIPLFLEITNAMAGATGKSDGLAKSGGALRTVFETIAVLGANVAYVMNAVGSEIGGIAAQIAALGRGDFKAFSNIGAAMREDAEKARKDVDALTERLLNPRSPAASSAPAAGGGIASAPQKIKPLRLVRSGGSAKKESATDPLTPAAEAYAKALESINQASVNAQKSTLDLNAAQEALYDLMRSPTWADMPEAWKQVAIAQSQAGAEAIKTAENYNRLKELLAATPTEKLEQMRESMMFLADAFYAGKISAEQFSEAASTALGSIPEEANKATDAMEEFSKQAARNIQDAFADFLFDPFKDGVDGMLKGFGDVIKRMIANAVAADLGKRIFGKAGGGEGDGLLGAGLDWLGNLFANADGGVYTTPGLSALSGRILTGPTLIPMARGGILAGEAGPEAIMPLKRGADGKLGVSSGGGGHNINVYVTGTNAQDVRRAAGQGAREGLAALAVAQRYR